MKKTLWILPLLAVAAACNKAPANNVAAANTAAPTNQTGSADPAPVQGAQQTGLPPGLDCVRNRLTPEQRRDVAQAAMEQASREDPRAQALLQAVAACGDESSWSPQKRQFATAFSMSAAGASGLREFLGGRGVNLEELDRLILSDQELMAAAESGELGSAGQAFAARHAQALEQIAGGGQIDQELGTRIGNYIAFRAAAEAFGGRFGREP